MNKREISESDKIEALTKITNLCHANLFTNDGRQVLHYLKEVRGLTEETIRAFKLGAFPSYADVAGNAAGTYTSWKCGVIGFNKEGEVVSKFSTHKIIIPVCNADNQVIAIMGRSMLSKEQLDAQGLPKYTNSYYKKTSNLFGLGLMKDDIRKLDEVYLVEGNLDVITAWQYGMRNVVATSSANLSRMQLLIAGRYAKNVRILFDADEAGQKGTSRALDRYQDSKDLVVSEANLPTGPKDLDEFFINGYYKENTIW